MFKPIEKHENLNLYQKRVSTDANNEMKQMLVLSDKDIRSITIKIFRRTIMSILETNILSII
jgi:hypothetical protein